MEKQNRTETDSRIKKGNFGELLVAHQLEKRGYKIIRQNYRQKFGEVDLIAQNKNIISFIEVKFRQKEYFNLSEVITSSKQKKIILAAKNFIAKSGFVDKVYRFDVALITNENEVYKIRYIRNAFTESRF